MSYVSQKNRSNIRGSEVGSILMVNGHCDDALLAYTRLRAITINNLAMPKSRRALHQAWMSERLMHTL